MKTKLIFFLLILFVNNVYAVKVCKDENGRSYFTDVGCPEGTEKKNEMDVKDTNTYSARDSIDIGTLNDYERRYNTGKTWMWVEKKRRSNNQ